MMRGSEEWEHADAGMRRYIEASNDQTTEERKMQVRFAAVLCQCSPWYDHEDPGPAQYGCLIHTTIMFDRHGEWL
jgi:hypothetical protein